MSLEKGLVLLGDEIALVGDEFCVAREDEVKPVKGNMDKSELIMDEGWI